MFLSLLDENEKKSFLNIALYSMGLNGSHKDEEKEVYASFLHECDLLDYEGDASAIAIDGSVDHIARSRESVRKIVILEVYGILLADGEVCSEERKFMDMFANKCGLDAYQARRIERWVSSMNDLVSEGYRIVGV